MGGASEQILNNYWTELKEAGSNAEVPLDEDTSGTQGLGRGIGAGLEGAVPRRKSKVSK